MVVMAPRYYWQFQMSICCTLSLSIDINKYKWRLRGRQHPNFVPASKTGMDILVKKRVKFVARLNNEFEVVPPSSCEVPSFTFASHCIDHITVECNSRHRGSERPSAIRPSVRPSAQLSLLL